jgi:uncharacterized tellurite resistance protein B-like protein
MSTEPASDEFAFELMKLLLQVAWADDDVAHEESNALLAFAKRNQLSGEHLAIISACLAGKSPLPPPNLGFLKSRRVDVLRAVKDLLTSDRQVAATEEAILTQISTLLR